MVEISCQLTGASDAPLARILRDVDVLMRFYVICLSPVMHATTLTFFRLFLVASFFPGSRGQFFLHIFFKLLKDILRHARGLLVFNECPNVWMLFLEKLGQH